MPQMDAALPASWSAWRNAFLDCALLTTSTSCCKPSQQTPATWPVPRCELPGFIRSSHDTVQSAMAQTDNKLKFACGLSLHCMPAMCDPCSPPGHALCGSPWSGTPQHACLQHSQMDNKTLQTTLNLCLSAYADAHVLACMFQVHDRFHMVSTKHFSPYTWSHWQPQQVDQTPYVACPPA